MDYMEIGTIPTKHLSKDRIDFLQQNNEEGKFLYVSYKDGQLFFEKKIYYLDDIIDKVKPNELIIFTKSPTTVKGFEITRSWGGDYALSKINIVDLLKKIEEYENEIWELQTSIVEITVSNLIKNFEEEKAKLEWIDSDLIRYVSEDNILLHINLASGVLNVIFPDGEEYVCNLFSTGISTKLEKEYKQ